jgi:hypothetical protein
MGSTVGLVIGSCTGTGGVGLAYGAMPALIMGAVPQSETASANSFNSLMRAALIAMAIPVRGPAAPGGPEDTPAEPRSQAPV